MANGVRYQFFEHADNSIARGDLYVDYSPRYDFLTPLRELSAVEIQEKACQINNKDVFLNLLRQLNKTFDNPCKGKSEAELMRHAYSRGWINEETFSYWRSHGIFVKKGTK